MDDDPADGHDGTDVDGSTLFEYDATLDPADDAVPEVLRAGDIEVLGAMPWSSNNTFLVQVTCGAEHLPAIYKPERGERPLWDFPDGLWKREVATSVLSDHLGVGLVPPTVTRGDADGRGAPAPAGRGSLQAFVPGKAAQDAVQLEHAGKQRRHVEALAGRGEEHVLHCLQIHAGHEAAVLA